MQSLKKKDWKKRSR